MFFTKNISQSNWNGTYVGNLNSKHIYVKNHVTTFATFLYIKVYCKLINKMGGGSYEMRQKKWQEAQHLFDVSTFIFCEKELAETAVASYGLPLNKGST